MTMTDARPSATWLDALRDTSIRLEEQALDLSEQELGRPSSAQGWTVAQVLSHLGSGAEICAMLVRRGLDGGDQGPQREEVAPIWERWDTLSPAAQRDAWLEADAAHLALLSSIDATTERALRVPYFAGPMTLETYLGYRLSEHAVHAWDIETAFRSGAVVRHLDLLWSRIDLIASRFHDGDRRAGLPAHEAALVRRDAAAVETLAIATDGLHVRHEPPADPHTTAVGTGDSLLRLFYGRSRAEDDLEVVGRLTRAQLVALFPGF